MQFEEALLFFCTHEIAIVLCRNMQNIVPNTGIRADKIEILDDIGQILADDTHR